MRFNLCTLGRDGEREPQKRRTDLSRKSRGSLVGWRAARRAIDRAVSRLLAVKPRSKSFVLAFTRKQQHCNRLHPLSAHRIAASTMAETQSASSLEHKDKLPCRFGAKCQRKKCSYVHPPPAANDCYKVAASPEYDPPVQPSSDPKPTKNSRPNDTQCAARPSEGRPKRSKKRAASMKPCKYGAKCQKKKCPFLHPEDTSTSSERLTVPSESVDDAILNHVQVSGGDKTEIGYTIDATTGEREALPPESEAESVKRCYRGAMCRRANCPFHHPTVVTPDSPQDAMMDVSILEAGMEATNVPQVMWAADLEDSLVAEACEKEQRSEKKESRRSKRGKEMQHRRARQQEEDRLIRAEEERLRLKEEAERIERELQEQERQRQLEAEEERQRQVEAVAESQRLKQQQTEAARIEIERIRREKIAQEQARQQQIDEEKHIRLRELQALEARKEIESIRQKKLAEEQERQRQAEDRKKRERVRIERKALERFKRAREEEKKSEEVARRLEEEERKLLDQEESRICREREDEEERRRLAQKNEEERRRQTQLQRDRSQQTQLREEDSTCQDRLQEGERHRADEEMDRYKAERKAAKKERRRLEREAKAEEEVPKQSPKIKQERSVKLESPPRNSTGSNQENLFDVNSQEAVEDEAAKKCRWQEELSAQKERAAEKRAQRQKIRRERLLEEQGRQTQERTQFWQSEIADEEKTVDMLVELCAAEFCRKNPDVDRQTLLADTDTRHKLEEAAHETYRVVCKADIHSRVIVKGMKQQDLNDRTGTIQNWDEGKGKFYVGLDTKKGKNTQYLYIPAGNLEALPLPPPRKGKKGDPVHMVFVPLLFSGIELMVDVYKSEIDAMKATPSLDEFLDKLMQDRDQEERDAMERKEKERRQEEESRRRRAEQRHRENEEWERRQAEYAKQKAEYQEWRQQEREEKWADESSRSYRENDEEHHPFCNCPRCALEHMFFGGMGRGGGRGGFFFSFGRGGPSFTFVFDDDTDDDDYEDDWDRAWGRMHEEEQAEKDAAAAEVLGVEVDAGEAEIKRVFRKKARKYHPDSYRAENHEGGMTKDEAEEYFKELSNAYDHLMSNFDEDDE